VNLPLTTKRHKRYAWHPAAGFCSNYQSGKRVTTGEFIRLFYK
jgi:hypothetical protein